MIKQDLALTNQKELICHETQLTRQPAIESISGVISKRKMIILGKNINDSNLKNVWIK